MRRPLYLTYWIFCDAPVATGFCKPILANEPKNAFFNFRFRNGLICFETAALGFEVTKAKLLEGYEISIVFDTATTEIDELIDTFEALDCSRISYAYFDECGEEIINHLRRPDATVEDAWRAVLMAKERSGPKTLIYELPVQLENDIDLLEKYKLAGRDWIEHVTSTEAGAIQFAERFPQREFLVDEFDKTTTSNWTVFTHRSFPLMSFKVNQRAEYELHGFSVEVPKFVYAQISLPNVESEAYFKRFALAPLIDYISEIRKSFSVGPLLTASTQKKSKFQDVWRLEAVIANQTVADLNIRFRTTDSSTIGNLFLSNEVPTNFVNFDFFGIQVHLKDLPKDWMVNAIEEGASYGFTYSIAMLNESLGVSLSSENEQLLFALIDGQDRKYS